MHEPFPDELEVPYGLVTTRLLCRLPVWAMVTCLALGITPLYFWGTRVWWASVIALGLGILIGKLSYEDPEFLQATIGQLRLKAYYD